MIIPTVTAPFVDMDLISRMPDPTSITYDTSAKTIGSATRNIGGDFLKSNYTGSSGMSSSDIMSLYNNLMSNELKATQMQIEADQMNAKAANDVMIRENQKNREFQQTSADKAMAHTTAEREAAQEFSAAQAKEQRDWEKMMSDTAISRAAADMQNAGINPIMAAGQPASTPVGASASSVGQSGTSAPGSVTSAVKANAYKADTSAAISSTISYINAKADRTQNKDLQTMYYRIIEDLGRYQSNMSAFGSVLSSLTGGLTYGAIANAGASKSFIAGFGRDLR